MAKSFRISKTNPIEDTIFSIRATINGPEFSSWKIDRIKEILVEYDKVMKEREDLGVVGLKGFPKGDDE